MGRGILRKTNQLKYYKPTSWWRAQRSASFLSVGYYFGNATKELGVPIGLINNAIGGSTTSMDDRHNEPTPLVAYYTIGAKTLIDIGLEAERFKYKASQITSTAPTSISLKRHCTYQ